MTEISRLTRLLLAAAVALTLALAFGGAAEPAFAHDQLVETTPGEGDTVDVAPESIEMVFSGSPQKVGNQIQVEHDGENVATGEPTTQFHTITQSLGPDLTPGDYTVDWRIVSEDGHPVSGTFTFTVKGTDPGAGDTAPGSHDSGTGTGTPAPTSTDSNSPQASHAASNDDSRSIPAGLIAAGAVVLIVIAAFVGFVVIRTRRSRRHG